MSKQPLEDKERGIHRAKTWEIAFYACNNLSTNFYMLLVGSIAYYLIGIVGLGSVLAGSIVTLMRIWDGVTDPFIGMIVDRTTTKFGKNRPFIVIGQIILFSMTFLMFHVIPSTPTSMRFILFIILYMVYIIGYTFQCVVTKSAQSCLTNDPKQRPMFAMFDSVYILLVFSLWYPVYSSTTLIPTYTLTSTNNAVQIASLIASNPNLANVISVTDGVQTLNGFYNPQLWTNLQLLMGGISAVLAVLAIIGLWRKDRPEYFGIASKQQKVTFHDYVDVIAHNRGIQMLVVAASTDKLAANVKGNSAVMMCLYGVIFGSYALYGTNSQLVAVPALLLTLLAFNNIARKLGQKKCLVVGTWGSLICAAIITAMIVMGAQKGMLALPNFSLTKPGTWGNLFSGWRLISSLSSTFVSLIYAAVGFSAALPTNNSPFSTSLMWATIACFIGLPVFGWLCNVIAMKFYPLTKEKMEEIQGEVARIKAEAAKEQPAA